MPICRESPTTIFQPGTVIEDCNAVMKINKFYQGHSGHSYQVEVLKWNLQPPEDILSQIDPKSLWILVTAESISKIKVIQ
jgi:hypothetical protein